MTATCIRPPCGCRAFKCRVESCGVESCGVESCVSNRAVSNRAVSNRAVSNRAMCVSNRAVSNRAVSNRAVSNRAVSNKTCPIMRVQSSGVESLRVQSGYARSECNKQFSKECYPDLFRTSHFNASTIAQSLLYSALQAFSTEFCA